nr:DUF2807 domain-containing protein [Pseudomonadota bacterium]
MRKTMLVAAAAAAVLGGCGQRTAGPPVQRDFRVGAFESVSLGGSHEVNVAVGGAPSVRAEGPQELLDRLEIEVRDGDLRIGSRGGHGSFFRHGRVTVHVTVPSLSSAQVGGSGSM